VQIFSLGTDHGQFYVVMEWSITEARRSHGIAGPLPEHQVLDIASRSREDCAQLTGRVDSSRREAANILFVDEQAAKIGDFGLAALQHNSRRNRQRWCALGTPPYSRRRDSATAEDVRSDIKPWRNAVHAVAGKAPIDSSTNSATELYALKQHRQSCGLSREGVWAEARVLQRMIASDPKQRFLRTTSFWRI